jgi:hypothetical protein
LQDNAHDDDDSSPNADEGGWHSYVKVIAEIAAKLAEFAPEIADSYR